MSVCACKNIRVRYIWEEINFVEKKIWNKLLYVFVFIHVKRKRLHRNQFIYLEYYYYVCVCICVNIYILRETKLKHSTNMEYKFQYLAFRQCGQIKEFGSKKVRLKFK